MEANYPYLSSKRKNGNEKPRLAPSKMKVMRDRIQKHCQISEIQDSKMAEARLKHVRPNPDVVPRLQSS